MIAAITLAILNTTLPPETPQAVEIRRIQKMYNVTQNTILSNLQFWKADSERMKLMQDNLDANIERNMRKIREHLEKTQTTIPQK